jgi:alpha-tubulin suppressor-like RCC1 family protein
VNEKIIDMCCGVWHSVLLTQCGKVYEFNYLKEKSKTTEVGLELKNFKNNKPENEIIVMISCGFMHSLALTESGHVFVWVHNHNEQFGVNNSHIIEPNIIDMNDIKIKKISCGPFHSLLLSCDGHIYAFGWNICGEVGNGTQVEQREPIEVGRHETKEFIDIATHPNRCISMSKSIDNVFYFLGTIRRQIYFEASSKCF